MTIIKTTQIPATAENDKWSGSVFHKFFTLVPDSGPKAKRRTLPESTPDPWPPLIWISTDDAYIVGEIYTLLRS